MSDIEDTAIATPAPAMSPRDALRAKIFNAKAKSVLVENFLGGSTIELRQPSVKDAMAMRQGAEEDRIFVMLTDFAFVPGTDEKVFDPEDVDSLKGLPFGEEMQNLMKQVTELLGTDPEEVERKIKEAEKSA